MKKFLVTVNGNRYDVEVEEIKESTANIPYTSSQTVNEAVTPISNSNSSLAKEQGVNVTTLMPGTIIKINVSVGQGVKKGQLLMVLEAMKMENEITAPISGKVISINVLEGNMVNSGEILMHIA